MLTTLSKWFALLSVLALARGATEDRNLTISLYSSDEGDSCEEGGSGGITLTTNSIPLYYTCIDVDAIFGGDSRVGFANDSVTEYLGDSEKDSENDTSGPNPTPPGIHWYISSEDGTSAYNKAKNWTNVRIRQMNETQDDGREEGKVGRWVITTYGDANCERINVTEFPWYRSTCQTEGSCENSLSPIKGIRIEGLEPSDLDTCQTWAMYAAAPGLVPRASVALVAALVVFMII